MNVVTRGVVHVGVRDLKAGLSAYLARVGAGEEIVVTDRGRPVARLTALAPDSDALARLIQEGVVQPPRAPRQPSRRRTRLRGPGSVQELVADQRR